MRLRTIWRAIAQPSLTRRLLCAQMGLLVVLWLGVIAYFVYDIAYVNEWYEPRQMRERADMILAVVKGMADRPAALRRALEGIDKFQRDEYRENDAEGVRVSLNVWLDGQLVYATPGEPGVIRVTRVDELETSTQNGRRIRSYARDGEGFDGRVVLSLPADAKSVFITFWAGGIVLLPLLLSMPLLLVPAWLSVRLALSPFRDLARQVARKGADDLEPLAFRARHRELRPLVRSVNGLLSRIREGIGRERRFIADAAHELRTPIAAVAINAEALQERGPSSGETDATRSLLASLLSSSRRASRLVAQLLALMRSDATVASAQAHAVGDLTQECLAAAAPFARLTDVELELQCDGSGPLVRGHREGLVSLVQNLVDNAIKYSPPGGTVRVEICQRGNRAELRVSDEGPGIPPEFRQRVFERFYRLPSESQAGSGLGLAIVKTVADRLGATVALETAPSGRGLLIRVGLAVASADAAAA